MVVHTEDPMNEPLLRFLAAHARPGHLEMLVEGRGDRHVLAYNKEPFTVWDFLQAALPVDCRCLLYGRCALVAPSGVILAVVIGDTYVLRVPDDIATAVLQTKNMKWYIDVKKKAGNLAPNEQFGNGWIWGMSQKEEPTWCRMVYDAVEHGKK